MAFKMSKEFKQQINDKVKLELKNNIFVALDFSSFDKALDTAKSVKNDAAGLKITNELYAICGKEGLKKFKYWY